MAQIKVLKIASDGMPLEMDSSSDEVTLASFTVQGGGPVLGASGLDLNSQDIIDIKDVKFNDSSTAGIYINSTNFVADKMMFESKENSMDTGAAVLFPIVTDSADLLDAFRLPAIAGTPSATPTDGGTGYLVYDSTNLKPYVWTGSEWDDLSTVATANAVDDIYTADEDITATEVVYISAADNVSLANTDTIAKSYVIGVAIEDALDTEDVTIRKMGALAGFTGLTAGSRYFLDDTAGAIVTSAPTGSGNTVVQIGYAKSTTVLDIQIQGLGRRA